MIKQAFFSVLTLGLTLLSSGLQAQTPYPLVLTALDGSSLPVDQYSGRKLLVVVIDASAPDSRQLKVLDSLYRADSAFLSVIAVPAQDFGDPLDNGTLTHLLRDSLGLLYPITQPGMAAKASEGEQQPLLSWLTHPESNQHFDKDITEAGRMYLVSEAGSLYALFQNTISVNELNVAIHQTVTP